MSAVPAMGDLTWHFVNPVHGRLPFQLASLVFEYHLQNLRIQPVALFKMGLLLPRRVCYGFTCLKCKVNPVFTILKVSLVLCSVNIRNIIHLLKKIFWFILPNFSVISQSKNLNKWPAKYKRSDSNLFLPYFDVLVRDGSIHGNTS